MRGTPPKSEKEYGLIESNVVSIEELRANRLMTGGNEPPMAPGKDYLSPMVSGTEFLVRDKTGTLAPRWHINEWIHGGLHRTGNVLLIPAKDANNVKAWTWVDPKEFCKSFELRGVLHEDD